MSDAKRTKNYIVFKLRKNYREGKLDTSQVARLKAIGFDFDGAVFNASKDSLAVQYPAIAEEWDKERNGEQTPWKVRPLATKKAWWRCPHCDRPYRLAIRSKVISNSGWGAARTRSSRISPACRRLSGHRRGCMRRRRQGQLRVRTAGTRCICSHRLLVLLHFRSHP